MNNYEILYKKVHWLHKYIQKVLINIVVNINDNKVNIKVNKVNIKDNKVKINKQVLINSEEDQFHLRN